MLKIQHFHKPLWALGSLTYRDTPEVIMGNPTLDNEEEQIGCGEAAREIKVDPMTINRWITRGCLGHGGGKHFLGAVRVGGKWRVSRESLKRFFIALGGQAEALPDQPTPADRRRAVEAATRECEAVGA